MSIFLQIIVAILVLLGAFISLTSALGLLRFPDTFCRMHALGANSTMGVICVMWGTLIFLVGTGVGLSPQALLAIVFLLCTSSIGTHMIAKATYHYGNALCEQTVCDDLQPMHEAITTTNADI